MYQVSTHTNNAFVNKNIFILIANLARYEAYYQPNGHRHLILAAAGVDATWRYMRRCHFWTDLLGVVDGVKIWT